MYLYVIRQKPLLSSQFPEPPSLNINTPWIPAWRRWRSRDHHYGLLWGLTHLNVNKGGAKFLSPGEEKYLLLWWWLGLFPRLRGLGGGEKRERIFDHSFPACAFFFFFWSEISSRTLIPHFIPGSVHSGSARWDDRGRISPDKLRVSSFPAGSPSRGRDVVVNVFDTN